MSHNKLNGLTKTQAELLKNGLILSKALITLKNQHTNDFEYLELQLQSIIEYHNDIEKKERT